MARRCLPGSFKSLLKAKEMLGNGSRREGCLRVAQKGSCDCSAEHDLPLLVDVPEPRSVSGSFAGYREKDEVDRELSSPRRSAPCSPLGDEGPG